MRDASRPEAAVWYGDKFDDIDGELAKYVAVCGLDLLDPRIVDRVLRGDRRICCELSDMAYAKMRHLLMMHFIVRSEAVQVLGELHTRTLIREVLARLRARVAPEAYPHFRLPPHRARRWSASSTKPAPARLVVT